MKDMGNLLLGVVVLLLVVVVVLAVLTLGKAKNCRANNSEGYDDGDDTDTIRENLVVVDVRRGVFAANPQYSELVGITGMKNANLNDTVRITSLGGNLSLTVPINFPSADVQITFAEPIPLDCITANNRLLIQCKVGSTPVGIYNKELNRGCKGRKQFMLGAVTCVQSSSGGISTCTW